MISNIAACIHHKAGLASSTVFGSDSSQSQYRRRCAAQVEGHLLAFHQAHSTLDIIGRSRMAESLEHQVIVFIPLAGMDMQFGDPSRGETLPQPFAKQISKEMVIAVPAPLVVLRDDEQVGALEIFQGCLPGNGWVEQNGIAKRPAHAVEDGSAQQESLDTFGLLVPGLLRADSPTRKRWLPVKDWMKLVVS